MYGDFGHFEFEFKKGTYRSKKIFLLIRWSQSTHRSLSLKGLVKKVYRAFIMSIGKISAAVGLRNLSSFEFEYRI